MILDGYNRHATLTVDGMTLSMVYRPMLSAERRQFVRFLRQAESWSREVASRETRAWLYQHIVAMDYDGWLSDLQEHSPKLFRRVVHVLAGVASGGQQDWDPQWETHDVENLRQGVRLAILNPRLDKRSCDDCQKWWYSEETGQPVTAGGLPVLRTTEALMCQTETGCAAGLPDKQNRLTLHNREAWHHFQLCEATGTFPDDPIVRRNALVIRQARAAAQGDRVDGYGAGQRRDAGQPRERSVGVVGTNGFGRNGSSHAGTPGEPTLFGFFGVDVFTG